MRLSSRALRRGFPETERFGTDQKEGDRGEKERERARETSRPEPCEGGKPHSGLFTTTETDRVVKSPGQPVLNSRGRRKEEGDGLAKTETAKTRPGRIGRAQMDLFGEAAATRRETSPAGRHPAAARRAGPQRPAARPPARSRPHRLRARRSRRPPPPRAAPPPRCSSRSRRRRPRRLGCLGRPPSRWPRSSARSRSASSSPRTVTSWASTTRRGPSSRRSRKRSTTRSTRARRPASSPELRSRSTTSRSRRRRGRGADEGRGPLPGGRRGQRPRHRQDSRCRRSSASSSTARSSTS